MILIFICEMIKLGTSVVNIIYLILSILGALHMSRTQHNIISSSHKGFAGGLSSISQLSMSIHIYIYI